MAKKTDYERCKERYNDIMWDICVEHCTIGTNLTEDAEKKAKWNIRDMVAEAYYWLTCYTESGNCRYEDRLYDEECYRSWLHEKGRLERFVRYWDAKAMEIPETYEHHSHFVYGKYAA